MWSVCRSLRRQQDKFPEAAIREAGYGAIWHGEKSWNGVGILARGAKPIETRRGLPGGPEKSTAAISKRRSAALSSDASICQTAIPRPGRNSITSCAGSIGSSHMRPS